MLFTELAFRGPYNIAIFTCHISVKPLNAYISIVNCEAQLRFKD